MAQRPTNDFNIDPNVTSGTDLANILNRFQDAIDSGNSGPSRPAYLEAGGLWVREGDPMRLYLYDGTTDRELYNTTDGLVGASQWKDNGSDIYYNDGNVGIGTDNPSTTLDVKGSARIERDGSSALLQFTDTGVSSRWIGLVDGTSRFAVYGTNGSTEEFVIDSSGNVGIGMSPTRSAFDLSAKEQLAQWKAKAKKASWPIVTDGAFEQEPTEDLVAQWIETRAAGDKLQVDGNGSFTGFVNAGNVTIGGLSVYNSSAGGCGLRFTTGNQIRPASNTGAAATTGTISIGDSQSKFKDAYFSGDVNAGGATFSGSVIGANTGGVNKFVLKDGASYTALQQSGQNFGIQPQGGSVGMVMDGSGTTTFTGNVTANKFSDASGPIVSAFTMVEAFRKIKTAVSDETTVEGIKESLTNVLGGLIEEFESIGTKKV